MTEMLDPCVVPEKTAQESSTVNLQEIRKGKKKSRRKNKNNVVTYPEGSQKEDTTEISDEDLQKPLSQLMNEDPVQQPEKGPDSQPTDAPISEPPQEVPVSPVIFPGEGIRLRPMGDGVRTDARLPEKTAPLPESPGLIYELAEELYRREKTMSELEALSQPPFHKVFSDSEKEELDRQAGARTDRLLAAASEAAGRGLTFVPDGLTEPNEKPIATSQAFVLQLLLMIPVVNIIAALFMSFGRNTNVNLRAFTRSFLIMTVIAMSGLLIYFGIFFFTSSFGRERLAAFASVMM